MRMITSCLLAALALLGLAAFADAGGHYRGNNVRVGFRARPVIIRHRTTVRPIVVAQSRGGHYGQAFRSANFYGFNQGFRSANFYGGGAYFTKTCQPVNPVIPIPAPDVGILPPAPVAPPAPPPQPVVLPNTVPGGCACQGQVLTLPLNGGYSGYSGYSSYTLPFNGGYSGRNGLAIHSANFYGSNLAFTGGYSGYNGLAIVGNRHYGGFIRAATFPARLAGRAFFGRGHFRR